jgi:hypothetical protein
MMTSRELLRAPRDQLSSIDRQRQHVLQVESTPVPCPACKVPVDAITAGGRDVNEYPFGRKPPAYRCPHCAAVLDRVTPLIAFGPGWHWALNYEWLADRLRKAALYDKEHPGEAA